MNRSVLLVCHTGRDNAVAAAREVASLLVGTDIGIRVLDVESSVLAVPGAQVVASDENAGAGCEIVIVLGGDGTLLRAAEFARTPGTPLLGVNLGHIGFLAEAEPTDLAATVAQIVDRRYEVEERLTLDVEVCVDGRTTWSGWALNEASIEKAPRERMLDLVVEVDGRPLSEFGCDGVVVATATGSTAYAFSAGGPVVWPDVAALLVVPLNAHALFSRPVVVTPQSSIAVHVVGPEAAGWATCDGRRSREMPPGAVLRASGSDHPLRLARLHPGPFVDRLVAKFQLPVRGWRGTATHRS